MEIQLQQTYPPAAVSTPPPPPPPGPSLPPSTSTGPLVPHAHRSPQRGVGRSRAASTLSRSSRTGLSLDPDALQHLRSPYNVYIKGLPASATDDQLRAWASGIAEPLSIKTIRELRNESMCSGIGFVKFVSPEQAAAFVSTVNATDGYEACFAKETYTGKMAWAADPRSSNLYISHIPLSFDEDDVSLLFPQDRYTIESMRLLLHSDQPGKRAPVGSPFRGAGFVRLSSRAEAEAAISELNGKRLPAHQLLPEGYFETLQVRFADTPAQRVLKVQGKIRDHSRSRTRSTLPHSRQISMYSHAGHSRYNTAYQAVLPAPDRVPAYGPPSTPPRRGTTSNRFPGDPDTDTPSSSSSLMLWTPAAPLTRSSPSQMLRQGRFYDAPYQSPETPLSYHYPPPGHASSPEQRQANYSPTLAKTAIHQGYYPVYPDIGATPLSSHLPYQLPRPPPVPLTASHAYPQYRNAPYPAEIAHMVQQAYQQGQTDAQVHQMLGQISQQQRQLAAQAKELFQHAAMYTTAAQGQDTLLTRATDSVDHYTNDVPAASGAGDAHQNGEETCPFQALVEELEQKEAPGSASAATSASGRARATTIIKPHNPVTAQLVPASVLARRSSAIEARVYQRKESFSLQKLSRTPAQQPGTLLPGSGPSALPIRPPPPTPESAVLHAGSGDTAFPRSPPQPAGAVAEHPAVKSSRSASLSVALLGEDGIYRAPHQRPSLGQRSSLTSLSARRLRESFSAMSLKNEAMAEEAEELGEGHGDINTNAVRATSTLTPDNPAIESFHQSSLTTINPAFKFGKSHDVGTAASQDPANCGSSANVNVKSRSSVPFSTQHAAQQPTIRFSSLSGESILIRDGSEAGSIGPDPEAAIRRLSNASQDVVDQYLASPSILSSRRSSELGNGTNSPQTPQHLEDPHHIPDYLFNLLGRKTSLPPGL